MCKISEQWDCHHKLEDSVKLFQTTVRQSGIGNSGIHEIKVVCLGTLLRIGTGDIHMI